MIDLEQIKITGRDQDVLKLLVAGCSNKEIAVELKSAHVLSNSTCGRGFLRAGIKQGRKRVILATAVFEKAQIKSCLPVNS